MRQWAPHFRAPTAFIHHLEHSRRSRRDSTLTRGGRAFGADADRGGLLRDAGAHPQDHPARGRQRDRALRRGGAGGRREVDRVRHHHCRDAADRRRLPAGAAGADPAQVPDPGDGLPDRVPGDSDHLHGQHRLHELLDGPPLLEGGGDLVDPEADACRAAERQDVPDDARGEGRRPRADPPRRGHRQVVRRHEEGARAARRPRRSPRRPASSPASRATRSSRARSCSRSTRSWPPLRSPPAAPRRSGPRGCRMRSSWLPRFATTRPATTSSASRTGRSSPTTRTARSCRPTARSSSRAGRPTSAPRTSARSSTTR